MVWDFCRLDTLPPAAGLPTAGDTPGDPVSLSELLWGSGVVRLPAVQPIMVGQGMFLHEKS